MTKYAFTQLVDIEQLRHLLESHHNLTGMAYGLFDTDENNLIAVGRQDICVQYHRVNPVSCWYCHESDTHIKVHLRNFQGDFLEYRCKNGMIDIAIPIIIDGTHMATLFTGHFFYDDDLPDKEFFLTQAWALGFDPDGYLDALDDVPVFSREYVRKNVLFLRNMVNLLAEKGIIYLKQAWEAEERKQAEKSSYRRVEGLRALVDSTHDPTCTLRL